jgi:AraC-like DNA-binding protein
MDRLTTVLSHFNPTALTVNYLTPGSPWSNQGLETSPIYLVHQGSGRLTLSDGQAFDFKPGDLLWLPFGGEHLLTAETDLAVVQCELAFGTIQQNPIFERLPQCIQIPADQQHSNELSPLMALMIQEASSARCGQGIVLNRLAEVLIVKMLRHLMANGLLQHGVMAGLSDIRLARALTAIHDHPDTAWRVEQLAQQAGMSRTLFIQQFRDRVGQTPGEYLLHWRMKLATRWLQQTNWPITAIASKLGYESETAFRRAFSREVGQPPGQVRKQQSAVT